MLFGPTPDSSHSLSHTLFLACVCVFFLTHFTETESAKRPSWEQGLGDTIQRKMNEDLLLFLHFCMTSVFVHQKYLSL